MLEYVFFDQRPQQRFVAFLRQHGIDATVSQQDETLEVAVPEDVDDELAERIEAFYDRMMDYNQELLEAKEADAGGEHQAAGIVLDLQNGETVYARVDPALLARIMGVVTPDELSTLVDAIVKAVENPDNRTLCQR